MTCRLTVSTDKSVDTSFRKGGVSPHSLLRVASLCLLISLQELFVSFHCDLLQQSTDMFLQSFFAVGMRSSSVVLVVLIIELGSL